VATTIFNRPRWSSPSAAKSEPQTTTFSARNSYSSSPATPSLNSHQDLQQFSQQPNQFTFSKPPLTAADQLNPETRHGRPTS